LADGELPAVGTKVNDIKNAGWYVQRHGHRSAQFPYLKTSGRRDRKVLAIAAKKRPGLGAGTGQAGNFLIAGHAADADSSLFVRPSVVFQPAIEIESEGAGGSASPWLAKAQVGQGQAGDGRVAQLLAQLRGRIQPERRGYLGEGLGALADLPASPNGQGSRQVGPDLEVTFGIHSPLLGLFSQLLIGLCQVSVLSQSGIYEDA
jgi:hypothetical protein